MTDGYRTVLAVTAAHEAPWDEIIRSALPAAFRGIGLDWQDVDHVRARPGLLLSAPPAATGRLAGGFAQALADALTTLSVPVQLGIGLAVGMRHRDARGWYGDAVSTARRLAQPGPGDVRLAIGAGLAAELGGVAEVRTASSAQPRSSMAPDGPSAGPSAKSSDTLTPAGPEAQLIAEAVAAVAASVTAFAEQLPDILAPDVAPADVLRWMYQALGVDSPLLLDDRHGRRLLADLVRCYQRRGTAGGLAQLIELRYGVGVEIIDPGRATWSATPETPSRRQNNPVTVLLDNDEPLDGLDEVIRTALPVGVSYRLARKPWRAAGPTP